MPLFIKRNHLGQAELCGRGEFVGEVGADGVPDVASPEWKPLLSPIYLEVANRAPNLNEIDSLLYSFEMLPTKQRNRQGKPMLTPGQRQLVLRHILYCMASPADVQRAKALLDQYFQSRGITTVY